MVQIFFLVIKNKIRVDSDSLETQNDVNNPDFLRLLI